MWRGEGAEEIVKRDRERGRQKVGGWRRIMDSLQTNALPEVVLLGGQKFIKEKR